ncbi:hypothetical protein A9Q78_04065 [Methylophaga sp. 41_12_T18]|nr:hypothetical protein A9Q78_04065 [Methylophaga sp. 41_12_T18]
MEIQPFGQQVQQLAKSDDKKETGSLGQTVSALAHSKNQLNAAILQSNANVSLSTGNESLSLLYKTAIEGINDALQATHGDNAIQEAYDSGLDVSPEATAERIVSLSTAFFGSYQQQNPELSLEEAVVQFTDIISGGIDQGFGEARDILSGLQVLNGDIASNIDKTYELVQSGLTSFVESYINSPQ